MKLRTIIIAAALVASAAAVQGAELRFGGGAIALGGGVGLSPKTFTNTRGTTGAIGFQIRGGEAQGLSETTSDAVANFKLGTDLGFGANVGAGSTSTSQSGSLTNGTGAAFHSTAGQSGADAGLALRGGLALGGAVFGARR